jgi:hypothetical protein
VTRDKRHRWCLRKQPLLFSVMTVMTWSMTIITEKSPTYRQATKVQVSAVPIQSKNERSIRFRSLKRSAVSWSTFNVHHEQTAQGFGSPQVKSLSAAEK